MWPNESAPAPDPSLLQCPDMAAEPLTTAEDDEEATATRWSEMKIAQGVQLAGGRERGKEGEGERV